MRTFVLPSLPFSLPPSLPSSLPSSLPNRVDYKSNPTNPTNLIFWELEMIIGDEILKLDIGIGYWNWMLALELDIGIVCWNWNGTMELNIENM